jgi:general secretion pathway protein A
VVIKKSLPTTAVISILSILLFSFEPSASQKEEPIAKAVADYLVAGRAVVAKTQPLINDPSKGYKGFTPDAYAEQVREVFKAMTGMDVKTLSLSDPMGKALIDLHESAKEAVADAQVQINEHGKAFKGFIPAVFGERTANIFYRKSMIRIKQTSLKFRGDYNEPDEFEAAILKKFESGWEKGRPYFEVITVRDRQVARYMLPVYITRECLSCHGEPAGGLDIAGKRKEGYKEGDLRGAISVKVSVK